MMIVLTAGETHTEAGMALTSLQANRPPSGEHPSVATTHSQQTTRGGTRNAFLMRILAVRFTC